MNYSEQPINPIPSYIDQSIQECKGLTKREYIAIQAMQAFCSIPNTGLKMKQVAISAVEMADELLSELSKPQ